METRTSGSEGGMRKTLRLQRRQRASSRPNSVHAQHHPALRRVQVPPDDVVTLATNNGSLLSFHES